MLDLRKPAGIYFLLIGVLLAGAGLLKPAYGAPLLDVDLNLYFGIFCLGFGAAFLWLARKG